MPLDKLWSTEEERLYSKDPNVVRAEKIALQGMQIPPGTLLPVRKGRA